ncbi:retron Se72 family effector protein [Shewanella subflava]|uniref:Retron Se72 family effector protein n=1 Tax=Shewanella subflava TaxID=2986476 RepID=A0ABT3I5S0_9GAMM|nr:retron Se72 family effector protein [Shewanella subflava]MCW3171416.1 retron Se72 family effector protein [Shewanella subflava]
MTSDTGFINTYDDFKCFGFIRREKGKDVYFSIDDFADDTILIAIGTKVKFEISKEPKGLRARNILIE